MPADDTTVEVLGADPQLLLALGAFPLQVRAHGPCLRWRAALDLRSWRDIRPPIPLLKILPDETRAVAFLRCLHAEANADKARKVLRQLVRVTKHIALVFWNKYHERK